MAAMEKEGKGFQITKGDPESLQFLLDSMGVEAAILSGDASRRL